MWKRQASASLRAKDTLADRRDSFKVFKMTRRTDLRSGPTRWMLQDAKARFSELVRRANLEGPQHVTVHGRNEVVVLSAAEFRRLKGERKGDAIIAALQASPYRDIDLAPSRMPLPVRDIDL